MINILNPLKHLSQTEKMILDTVHKFCKYKLPRRINEKNATKKIYSDYGQLGILGMNRYDLNYKMYGLISKELEYVDSGYRGMFSVQSSLVMGSILKYGTPEINNKYMDYLESGENIGCFGLTEPDSGSDASAMKTKAEYKNNSYVLNGSKTWITNAPIADVFIIWAKLDNKITGFVVDKQTKGLHTREIQNKLSMQTSPTGMIFLDNVKVPEINKLQVTGMKGPLTALNKARFSVGFGSLGAANACIDIALNYAENRKLFNKYLNETQLFQHKIVDMITEYNLGLTYALNVAEELNNNNDNSAMISMLKRNNAKKSLEIARISRDILGGNGITKEYNVFRHLCNLETVNTYEGTYDIQTLILGKYFTNKSSF